MNYWIKKEERAKKAQLHTQDMAERYENEIAECVRQSVIYGGPDKQPVTDDKGTPITKFINTDSVSAVFTESEGKTAVLNFASYKNPGGMFINGSSAQEESLCHESFLYNVLREFPQYYDWNNQNKNRALYKDRAIYSPNVVFERYFFQNGSKGKVKTICCDVITCAAPNKKAAQKYNYVNSIENYYVFSERMRFVKQIAEEQGVETLILGAWGAGVFGQDAREVVKIIRAEFKSSSIKKIVLAVPGNDENTITFKESFGG